MRLTIDQVIALLAGDHPAPEGFIPGPQRFCAAQLLETAIMPLEPEIVYVAGCDEAKKLGNAPNVTMLDIEGLANRMSVSKLEDSSILVIVARDNRFDLVDAINRRVVDLTLWDESLLDCLMKGSSARHLLTKAMRKLANPIALFDDAWSLVLQVGELPNDISGTIWELIANDGYMHMEILDAREEARTARMGESTNPVVAVPRHFKVNQSMSVGAPVFAHGVHVATISTTSIISEITSEQVVLLSHLARRLGQLLDRSDTDELMMDACASVLSRLAQGEQIANAVVERALWARRWRSNDHFRLYAIGAVSEPSDNPSRSHIAARLERMLGDSAVFTYDKTIAVVERLGTSAKGGNTPDTDRIEKLAKRFGAHIVIGWDFYGIHGISNSSTLCNAALSCNAAFSDRNVILVGDAYEDVIMDRLGRNDGTAFLCHPVFSQLLEVRNGGDYAGIIRMIRVLLECGGNVTQAARRLGIHRNTLRSSIARIRETSGLAFDDLESRDFLWMYMSCLVLEGEIRN